MHRLRNRTFFRLAIAAALLLVFLGFSVSAVPVSAFAAQQSASASSDGVTFTVEWDDAVPAGEVTTFHVSATGCSDSAMARMDVPSYWQPTYGDGNSSESVCDPTRSVWLPCCQLGEDGHDFSFEFTASGTYEIRFYFMDTENGIYYLRTTAVVPIDDVSRPSVDQIVSEAVAKAQSNTDGSDYQMALWLHDWLLDQLEYDSTYVWSSAESALTRATGICQAYEAAYSKLLTAAGVTNSELRDTADGHTWNAVKLDGKWCQIDATWDDSDNSQSYGFDARHLYFGLTDELMAIAHPGHSAIYSADGYATRSTSLENNYFVRNGTAQKWANAYKDDIQSFLGKRNESFSVSLNNAGLPLSIRGIQNGIIAYALSQMSWLANGKSVKLQATSDETSFTFRTDYSDGQGSGDSSSGGSDAGGSGDSSAGGSGSDGLGAGESGAESAGAAGESGATESGSSEANGTGSDNGSVEPGGADNASDGKIDSGSYDSRVQTAAIPALKKVTGLKLKAKKKAIKLSRKKGSADISGYQIRYSKSKKMKRAKTIKLARAAAKSKTIKKLAKKKRYYVQVRSYKILNGKTYYSAWSSKKSAKTK